MSYYSYCPECQNKYKKHEHCPECGIPLQPQTASRIKQHLEGDSNQAVQIAGNNQGDITIHQPVPQEGPTTLIQRETIKPIRIGNTPVKNWWFFVISALAIAADLITVIGYWLNFPAVTPAQTSHNNLMMFTTLSGMLLFVTAVILQRGRYITLPFGRTVERGKDGNLYLIRIGGTCGMCGSPVRVKTVGPKEYRQTRVTCTDNPDQHWWVFDRTVLGDVAEDYQDRQ
jgi:hypothetical protein